MNRYDESIPSTSAGVFRSLTMESLKSRQTVMRTALAMAITTKEALNVMQKRFLSPLP